MSLGGSALHLSMIRLFNVHRDSIHFATTTFVMPIDPISYPVLGVELLAGLTAVKQEGTALKTTLAAADALKTALAAVHQARQADALNCALANEKTRLLLDLQAAQQGKSAAEADVQLQHELAALRAASTATAGKFSPCHA